MKKFVLKFILLIFIISILFCTQVFCVLKFIAPQFGQDYTASLLDKIDRLKSIDGPKIVLIGNSQLSLGIDSAQIESALNMPVVNMGFHGGMGNTFHEEMAKLNVHEGDIYVLIHSDYSKGGIEEANLAWSTLENHKELWSLVSITDIPILITGFYDYVWRCMKLIKNNYSNQQSMEMWYNRDWVNKYGDVFFPKTESTVDFSSLSIWPPAVDPSRINHINRLNQYLNDRGAHLVVSSYPIANGENTAPVEEFIKFQNHLENLLDCDVISDWPDYMFDYSLFFDGPLHLTDVGADLRTKQLIKDLEKWLNN